jgi:hypothetical protein
MAKNRTKTATTSPVPTDTSAGARATLGAAPTPMIRMVSPNTAQSVRSGNSIAGKAVYRGGATFTRKVTLLDVDAPDASEGTPLTFNDTVPGIITFNYTFMTAPKTYSVQVALVDTNGNVWASDGFIVMTSNS